MKKLSTTNNIEVSSIRSLFYILIILLSLLQGQAFASPVELEIITPEAVVGESLSFSLKFNLDDENDPVDISQVKFQGAALPYQVTNRSSSSFNMVMTFNGKTVRNSSDVVRSYIFSLPTVNVGELILPKFSVSLDDETYQVGPISFQVLAKPTSENLRFLVTLNNPQSYYYPSQIIDLQYQILYRKFPGSPVIENISLPILQDMNFQLIPENQPNFKLPTNGQPTGVNARQGRTNYQGKTYNSMRFHLKFRLMQPGDFRFIDTIKMVIETGKRYRQPSLFFGSTIVNETKPIYGESSPLNIKVLQLPDENVPTSFNGAIGEFKIKVTPSSDTAIRVGDPITLAIDISGRGTWEFVKCPPIYKDSNITDYFIVSKEPVIGEVNSTKTMKSFSVRLRVKSKTIQEIPTIAFTYFNLISRKYITVYSRPVPITVFAAAQTAKITDYNAPKSQKNDHVENKNKQLLKIAIKDSKNELPPQASQEIKAILPPLIQIGDNVPYSMTLENQAPRYGRIFIAIGSLGVVFFLYLFLLFQGRDINEEKKAKHKSSKAFKNLLADLKKLNPKDENIASFSGVLGRRLHTFSEERFLCSLPHLDEQTLQPLIEQGKISSATARQFLDIIERIDQHRYATHTSNLCNCPELLTDTVEALKKCDL